MKKTRPVHTPPPVSSITQRHKDVAIDLEKALHREPIADRGISVVIPVRNRAGSLESLVTAISQKLEQTSRGHELIVVDDGSTDDTSAIAEQMASSNRRVRVVRHDRPEGFGSALRRGFMLAKYPLVLQVDDGHDDIGDIDRLLEGIDHVDVVCGVRRRVPQGWSRLSYWLYRRCGQLIFGVRVRDVDCGFRLFRRAALRRIPIQSISRFANVEILAKATFMNMLIGEAPLADVPTPANPSSGFEDTTGDLCKDAVRLFRRPQFRTSSSSDALPESTTNAA